MVVAERHDRLSVSGQDIGAERVDRRLWSDPMTVGLGTLVLTGCGQTGQLSSRPMRSGLNVSPAPAAGRSPRSPPGKW